MQKERLPEGGDYLHV